MVSIIYTCFAMLEGERESESTSNDQRPFMARHTIEIFFDDELIAFTFECIEMVADKPLKTFDVHFLIGGRIEKFTATKLFVVNH